jgi:hypothetical protein
MKDKELITRVVNAYDKARELTEAGFNQECHTTISRRKNRAVIAFLEDALAVYIGDILNNESYSLWIDQTFRAEIKNITQLSKNKTFNPDITIIKDGKIIGFIEVKESANPFRWNSNKFENKGVKYVIDRNELFLRWLPNNTITYLAKLEDKKQTPISVCAKPFFNLVFFSNKLFSDNKMKQLKKQIKAFDNTELFILIKGSHPNTNMIKLNKVNTKKELLVKIFSKKKNIQGLKDFRKTIEELIPAK